MGEQIEFLWRHLPHFLIGFPSQRPGGLLLSVLLAAVAFAVGAVVAVPIGLGHHARFGLVRFLARRWVGLFRGIPLLVLLVLIHQFVGAGRVPGIETSTLGSAFLALALYSSAYVGDIVTAGVSAVPQQLLDDARLLGAGRATLTRTVTLPYSLRVMRPALTTQAITIFKDSSVVVILGVADLTTTARIALGGDVGNAPFWVSTYLFVGFLYFVVAFGLARIVRRFEVRQDGRAIL